MKKRNWFFIAMAALLLLPATGTPALRAQDGANNTLEQQNAALVRRLFEEGMIKKNLAVVDEITSEDANWCPGHSAACRVLGNAFRKDWANRLFKAYSDLELTIEQVIPTGDTVIIELTGRGTSSNPVLEIMTGTTLTPTNSKDSWSWLIICTLKNGKVTQDRWYTYYDRWAVMPPA